MSDRDKKVPAADILNALYQQFSALSPEEQKRQAARIKQVTGGRRFFPNPGPQTEAYYCLADQLYYGGAAAGGKTRLLLGLATHEHKRSLILRRLNAEVVDLAERAHAMMGHKIGYNGQTHRWNMPDGRLVQFGGAQHLGDERQYMGQEKSFIGFDEAATFLEAQVELILGWLRSPDPKERCRVVFASNPPLTSDGWWLKQWFAPWLVRDHKLYGTVAEGELLYFERLADRSFRWERAPFDIALPNGKKVRAQSRTFIRSWIEDNAEIYTSGEYDAQLAGMPEPIRARIQDGSHDDIIVDDEWQVIPTSVVDLAMKRWTREPPPGVLMTSLGVDVAAGGADRTVIASRYENWFGPLVVMPGLQTPDGPATAGLILQHLRDGALVAIDAGGGWGGSPIDFLKSNNIPVLGVNPASASSAKAIGSKLRFCNLRAELLWKLREALEPGSGMNIALPPDTELREELTAARWKPTPSGILIESKIDIRRRIGKSPDKADALCLAWHAGSGARQRSVGFTARRDGRRYEDRPQFARCGYESSKMRSRQYSGRRG